MKNTAFIKIALLIVISWAMIWKFAFAHPGNTAADGCHYCRTNCDRWDEEYGERHCHGPKFLPFDNSPEAFESAYQANKRYEEKMYPDNKKIEELEDETESLKSRIEELEDELEEERMQ